MMPFSFIIGLKPFGHYQVTEQNLENESVTVYMYLLQESKFHYFYLA